MIEAKEAPVVSENLVLIRPDQNIAFSCSRTSIKSTKTAYRDGSASTLLTPGGFFHSVTVSGSSGILFMDESLVSGTGFVIKPSFGVLF